MQDYNKLLISESEAAGQVKLIYDEIKRIFKIDFVPNFFKIQACNISLLSQTWGMVKTILIQDRFLTRLEKEMIFTAISSSRGCQYCRTAHLAFCKQFSIDSKSFKIFSEGEFEKLAPAKLRDTIIFSIAVVNDPINADNLALQKHGFPMEKIFEVIQMSAFSVHANVLADTFKIQIDEEFLTLLGY